MLTVSADYFYKVCQPFVSVHSFDQIYHFKLVFHDYAKTKINRCICFHFTHVEHKV